MCVCACVSTLPAKNFVNAKSSVADCTMRSKRELKQNVIGVIRCKLDNLQTVCLHPAKCKFRLSGLPEVLFSLVIHCLPGTVAAMCHTAN